MSTTVLLLTGNKSDAQILYTDVDPDTAIIGYASYDLDLNNDGIDDIDIEAGNDLWYNFIEIWEFGDGSVMVTNTWSELPLALDDGAHITDDGNFEKSPPALIMASVFDYYGEIAPGFGNWLDAADKYLGVRVQIDTNYYYGWIRLSTSVQHDEPHTITTELKDYAIQLTPNTPIHAGDIDGCYTPIPVGTAGITSSSAKLKWGAVGGAEYYQVSYQAIIEPFWHNATVPAAKTFKKINGLLCDMPYNWKVRAYCSDGSVTEFSPTQNFTTAGCRLDDAATDDETAEMYTYTNQVHIDLNGDIPAVSKFELYGMDGKLVFAAALTNATNVFTLDIPNGIYIGRVFLNNTIAEDKLIITR